MKPKSWLFRLALSVAVVMWMTLPTILFCSIASAALRAADTGTPGFKFTWPPDASTMLLLWPIASGLISLFYNLLDGIPRVHALLQVLVSAGLDLPGILGALKRIWTGEPSALAKLKASIPPPPPAPKINLLPLALGLGTLLTLGVTQTGCAQLQANFPQLDAAEKIVLTDLAAGKGAKQIEEDVAQVFAGQAGVDAVIAVNDILTTLEDLGLIPPGLIPQAKKLHLEEKAKLKGVPLSVIERSRQLLSFSRSFAPSGGLALAGAQ